MYNAHFQFRESPFGTTPDPQFYYFNAVNREAWAALRYGIEGRKGFIVITGDAGTGKTTLLRKALHEFPSNIKAAYIPSTAVLGFDELLRLVLKDLGLATEPADKFSMMERLNHYLLERFIGGDAVALLIDEAQDLSLPCLEELRLLGNLETDKHKLLQVVLVGQPGLEHKLNLSELLQLRQRVVLRCRLRPIDANEVGPYIEARLQAVGRSSVDLFEPAAVERIAFHSRGFPRLINIICDNALLNVYADSRFRVSAEVIEEVAKDLLVIPLGGGTKAAAPALSRPLARNARSYPVHLNEPGPAARRRQPSADFADEGDTSRRLGGRGISRVMYGMLTLAVLGALWFSPQRIPRGDDTSGDAAARVAGLPEPTGPNHELEISRYRNRSSAYRVQPGGSIETSPLSNGQVNTDQLEFVQGATDSRAKGKPAAPPAVAQTERFIPPGQARGHASLTGIFFVSGASFVRSRPSSSAEIIATLEPGTRINIAGRTGAYYRIRSLGNEIIYGYVHEQDAFFERH